MTNLFTAPVSTPVILCGAPVVYVEGPADVVATDSLGNTYMHNLKCSNCAKDALYEVLEALGDDALDDVQLDTVVVSDGVLHINNPFGNPNEQIELDRSAGRVYLKRYHRYICSDNQVAQASYHNIDGTPLNIFERVYTVSSGEINSRYGVNFDGGFVFCVRDTDDGVLVTRYLQTSYIQSLASLEELNRIF